MIDPEIRPLSWEAAASLCAGQIDSTHADFSAAHPAFQAKRDHMEWLALLREEFDYLEGEWYGRKRLNCGDGEAEYYRSLAQTTLSTAMQCTGIEALTAEGILPMLTGKQADYGYENINRFGQDGIIVRMHDKIARLENLAAKGADPTNEPVMDSFMDLVGYCIIGMMVNYGIWNLPMRNPDSVIT